MSYANNVILASGEGMLTLMLVSSVFMISLVVAIYFLSRKPLTKRGIYKAMIMLLFVMLSIYSILDAQTFQFLIRHVG